MRKALIAFALLFATPAAAQLDGSGTITTGATAQQVFDTRPGRFYLFCQNPVAATGTLYVDASEPLTLPVAPAAPAICRADRPVGYFRRHDG